MPDIKQWESTLSRFTLANNDVSRCVYEKIISHYNEPHRYYHTLSHLDDCLIKLHELQGLADKPAEIEYALWFHDVIYDTKRNDNEEKSALWARTETTKQGISTDAAERIYDLIMMTRHAASPKTVDAQIIIDIDLSILGAEPEPFALYEQQIRQEYAWVPEPVFKKNRKKLLEEFLLRPAIYSTELFWKRYEQQARNNIELSLHKL